MKKRLIIASLLIACCILPHKTFAAIGATCVWEVRTTGNVNNGGGYTSGGTDYSQQAAAQYSLTSVTTTAADAILLHASAAAVMVGNIANITGGTNFTTGRYEIISVVAGVSITLDRTCTTAAGVGGTVEIGGAADHPDTVSGAVVAGNTVYIASGTYQPVGANAYVLNTVTAGGNGTPITWIGYTGSRAKATGQNRPLFDANAQTNSVYVDVNGNIFKNIRVTNALSDGVYSQATGGTLFINIKSSNNTVDGFEAASSSNYYIDCEASNNTGSGFNIGGTTSSQYYYVYSHDNSVGGLETLSGIILGSIADTNANIGYFNCSASRTFSSIAYNNTGASIDGFTFITDSANAMITFNNSSTNNGQYGFNRSAVTRTPSIFDYNLYNGNGTAGLNNITAGANDLTSDPSFNDPLDGDFTVGSSSPVIGAGFPNDWLLNPGSLVASSGTQADDSAVGTVAWVNPANAASSNNSYATFTGNNNVSHYLKVTNFGLSVPTDATITGIKVRIEHDVDAASECKDSTVKLVDDTGTVVGDNKNNTSYWSTTEAYVSYGSDNDLWGATWTPAQVNDSDFGVVLSAEYTTSGLAGIASVDHIDIDVFFTLSRDYQWNMGIDQDDNTASGSSVTTAYGFSE